MTDKRVLGCWADTGSFSIFHTAVRWPSPLHPGEACFGQEGLCRPQSVGPDLPCTFIRARSSPVSQPVIDQGRFDQYDSSAPEDQRCIQLRAG